MSTSDAVHVDRARQRRPRTGGIAGDHARSGSSDRAWIGKREQIASSHLPSPGTDVPRRAERRCRSSRTPRLDAVAVVDELVEQAAPVGLAPRLGHDDDVGVEAAHDLARRRSVRGACAPKRPVPQWALNDASVNSVRRSA